MKPDDFRVQTSPVTTAMALLLLITHSLADIDVLCPKKQNIISVFLSHFKHTSTVGLLSGLVSLIASYNVESKLGTSKYMLLIVNLLMISTFLEYLFVKLYPGAVCTMGMTGIALGILVYDIITMETTDPQKLILFTGSIALSLIVKFGSSFRGYMMGMIAGVICSIYIR